MKKSCKNQEFGRSIVELLGVLGIMGLISVGAFVLIRSGMVNQKRTMVMDDVSSIVTGVHALFADYDNYDKIGTDCTKGEDILAAIAVGADGPYDNVKYNVCRTTDKTKFIVVVSGLSASDCAVLAAKAWTGAVGEAAKDECSRNNRIKITYE